MPVKPTIPDVEPLLRHYYALPGNSGGGALHIVLEDGNVRDSDLEFCYRWAMTDGDWRDGPDLVDTGPRDHLGAALALALLAMSPTQRHKLYRTSF